MNNQTIGRLGEETAVSLLIQKGYQILCRNFRCKLGEIDIIAKKSSTLIFVEVKTRQSDKYGYPGDSITSCKKGNLERTAQCYLSLLQNRSYHPQNLQFDLIEINLNHIKDVI